MQRSFFMASGPPRPLTINEIKNLSAYTPSCPCPSTWPPRPFSGHHPHSDFNRDSAVMAQTEHRYRPPDNCTPSVCSTYRNGGIRMHKLGFPSMVGAMRLSTAVHGVVIVIAIAVVANLPTKAISCPQERPAPPGNVKRPARKRPKSTPQKQGGALIEYRNPQYGFCYSLPEDWRGYSIVVSRWQGYTIGPDGVVTVQQGPIISIRHPRRLAQPRQ
jgi:hypothetical protein